MLVARLIGVASLAWAAGFAVIKARNRSASLRTRLGQSLSSEIAAGRIGRPWLPATPRSPLPSVLRLKASLGEVLWRLRRSLPPPLGSPSGLHTREHALSLQAHARLVLSL